MHNEVMKRNQLGFGVVEILICLGILISISTGGWWVWHNHNTKSAASINTYAKCVNAGYPVLQSYPSVCVVNDKKFVNPTEKNKSSPPAPKDPASDKATYSNGTPVPDDSQTRAKAVNYYCPSWDAKPGELTPDFCASLDK